MNRKLFVPALLVAATTAVASLCGCDGKAAPMSADEKKSFEGHAPTNQGDLMRQGQENYRKTHPDEFKNAPASSGPGAAPPNAMPAGPPPGGGAPK